MFILMILFVLFVAFLAMTPRRVERREEIHTLKQEAHVYSGIQPEHFGVFINNMELFEEHVDDPQLASGYLYGAIGALEELALYTKSGASMVRDEIHALVQRIGIMGEDIILKNALHKGLYFRPTYLNNTEYFYRNGIQDEVGS